MCSLACRRINRITQVSHTSRSPRILNLNFNHLVIPKSVNPSRIEGGCSHQYLYRCQDLTSYPSALTGNLRLIELSTDEIKELENLGDKLERPYRSCMPGWLVHSPFALYVFKPLPRCVLGLAGAPSASPIAQTRSPGNNPSHFISVCVPHP